MECKFCGSKMSTHPTLIFENKEDNLRIFMVKFACGSSYEYSMIKGNPEKLIWNDDCTHEINIIKH